MHILITGASSGIGEAFAKHFSTLGWSLTLAARREKRLREIADKLPCKTFVRPVDLSDLSQCGPLVDDAIAALGPIDVLINNAGIQYVEPYIEVSDERAETLFKVDLLAPLRLQRKAAKLMLMRGGGTIVNVSSVAGLVSTPGMCHYNGAKSALAACSESLRIELVGSGVNVLTVYPGPVSTPMEASAREQFEHSYMVKFIPTGTADVLAMRVAKAIKAGNARIIYPRFYHICRYSQFMAQWVTNASTPPLVIKPH